MAGLNIFFLFIIGFIVCLKAGIVERIYIHENKPTLKGSDTQLVCEISQFSGSHLNVYKSDNPLTSSLSGITSLTQCFPSLCLTTTIGRYTISADSSHVFINITSVNRSEDQKWWTCAIDNQRKDLLLSVITVPTSLKYENPPSQVQDLIENAVKLKCCTGCSYPQPTISWYYSESGQNSLQVWSSSGTGSDTASGCSDSERKYSSTLSLPRYTTYPGNIQKTVHFKCSIQSFTGMSQPLFTNYSTDVQFAVKVSSATLKDGTNIVSGQLQVVSGVSKTLACDTGVSRPAAMIVWYIGTAEKQKSKSNTFTFNPDNNYHNTKVYCKAFNIQPENQAVISYQSTIQVQVQVSVVTLMDGSSQITGQLQVVGGVGKTLTCDNDVSRPAPTIVWYVGSYEKQRSTSNTFTFTPDNSDHNKKIYCKAFNIQPESQAVNSTQSALYVKVYATTPTLSNKTSSNLVLLENESITLECVTSATRPACTVTWMKGSESLTNIRNTNFAQGNLVVVKSVVTLTPGKGDDGKFISCQTFVSGQVNKPSVQQRVTVYWPPSTPVIPVTAFPFLEGQTGKSIYCSSNDYGNPASTATWTKYFGTPDSSDSRRLNLPTLTSQMNGSPVSCQLHNHFTQVKGLTKNSSTLRLNTEYTPIVQIMIDGISTNSVTRNEGQQLLAQCNTTGNPTPTVKWIGQISRNSILISNDIDRSSHGRYTCRAEATSVKYPNYDFVSEDILDITVNYAPEVIVIVSQADPIENLSIIISCNATGRPNSYIVTYMVQTWKGISIPNTHLPSNGPLDGWIEIQKPQLEDSGTYTCHVNNGIPDRNQKLDQIGKTDVSVKVSPKILLEDGHIFVGASGESINISIPFYSYPAIQTVKFRFKNQTEIQNSNKYTVSYTRQNVTAKFYGQPIELEGYVAVLNIDAEEQKDFINYTLFLENGIGQPKIWDIYHISESRPLAPKLITFTGFVDGVPTFLLMRNFNGGHPQTFIVETSVPPSEDWKEILRFNEADETFKAVDDNIFRFNVTGLSPNTYTLRVLSENMLGQVNESLVPTVKFTVLRPEISVKEGTINIGAIVGGISAVIVATFIVVIAVVVIMWKREIKQRDKKLAESNGSSTYDSLQRDHEAQSTYSSLQYAADLNKVQEDKMYENVRIQSGQTSSSF